MSHRKIRVIAGTKKDKRGSGPSCILSNSLCGRRKKEVNQKGKIVMRCGLKARQQDDKTEV